MGLDPCYHWKSKGKGGFKVHWIGDETPVDTVLGRLESHNITPYRSAGEILSSYPANFAAIIEAPNFVLAFVDTIRSYPIFYFQQPGSLILSNSARWVRAEGDLKTLNSDSVLEFSMAGFVTGRETLYENLFQLQAGELLFFDKRSGQIALERYYRFFPSIVREESLETCVNQLSEVTNRVFRRVIQRANGAPIWVPLSGGLDSRLVLCKLKEFGYDRLTAFSYGPSGNHEAKAAKYVAEQLSVPWIFVPSRHSESRKFFWSNLRRDYWSFSDGLCSVPNMQDIMPLLALRRQGSLPSDAIVINGQSGDFITGGHIPTSLMEEKAGISELLDAVINKHFSLWVHLKRKNNLKQIEEKIAAHLDWAKEIPTWLERMPLLFEYWEWQERQCKYVVNGQRIYEFLGLGWELPLWDVDYLHFWQSVPPGLKFGQKLYRSYLERYDFHGLFKEFNPTVWRWPGATISVVPVARAMQILFGERYKRLVYKYASYYGHFGYHYAPYGFKYFVTNISKARHAASFFVKTWIDENGIRSAPL